MQQITEVSKVLGVMPPIALVAVVILAGFALAGYAIFAVVTVSKGKRNGH
jgi:hypothetical protein